jgi:hypothetical protein
VRHAAIAMSSLYWRYMQNYAGAGSSNPKAVSLPTASVDKDLSFTLQQCSKALVSLRQSLATGGSDPGSSVHREAVHVACVILVSLALF